VSLGSRIRGLRKSSGLTQKEIADQLGMGSSNFGHIENDRVIPTSKDLDKIAEVLNTSTDYLLGREDQYQDLPAWATSKDKRDFKKLLEDDTEIMFDGVPLSDSDRQRVMDVLTGLFWEAKHMNKRKKKPDDR
jgi:transcriptional regulator with XRE-family HTH domain